MNVTELEGVLLDEWVAKAEGVAYVLSFGRVMVNDPPVTLGIPVVYSPSTNWAQGGPIIALARGLPYWLPRGTHTKNGRRW